ncbi:PREDICTED: microtubule-associated protein 70-1-like isoform X2 [Ipomoea nil]|uniref:microtubule-associated protein 70-1-like isoform X2 n=1 Tax=Ipomoea nil TaxID=35883 RepID=UPI0009016014|nr:PREDICTED: microtubule-associated protein 70-1-like isoform X2 [Ipomoea nil]XP_019192750.1 PREDICTED: microtubule-associated protein 70-1-like isoform X2 [Ipomoea nil]
MPECSDAKEENKILDKMHRQKVAEVEKLTQTVRELDEAVLAGGAAANAVRDYQRKVQEMNEERKTLDRELAHAKVTANRVATVVANEWKDSNDKVMPVKQWLEEIRFLQVEDFYVLGEEFFIPLMVNLHAVPLGEDGNLASLKVPSGKKTTGIEVDYVTVAPICVQL